MGNDNNKSFFYTMKKNLQMYSSGDIENGVVEFYTTKIKNKHNGECAFCNGVASILEANNFPASLEAVIELFEVLLDQNTKDENGIVFTPRYITDYISQSVFSGLTEYNMSLSIIDPGCGCGMFLVSAAEYIHERFNVDIDTIIENNIYGIDLNDNNVRRCKLVLKLLSAKYNGNHQNVETRICCRDSLDSDWRDMFNVLSFDYVIGNPPYVNPHDMNKNTIAFLKSHFTTTKSGVFNIFYAFIEQSIKYLSDRGKLGFIVPNNFLSIKSALDLRSFIQKGGFLERIIDFGDNMIFRPVRTYNCIIFLSKKKHDDFQYAIVPTANNIEEMLKIIKFETANISRLDKNGWKLVDEKTHKNLSKIENQFLPIKEFIRTGIATLRDGVYLVEKDENGYFKNSTQGKMYIESDLVKPIYKIPDLKLSDSISDVTRYIIFPYVKTIAGYSLIDEETFSSAYPLTYSCLLNQKAELDSRDKGKGASQGWYAYGRTQGLNRYGKKLLFPTFANSPKFIYVNDEDALFCNGYAVFENDLIDLTVLQKILNSAIMLYYVSNTSYSIEGGYYCFQKKYIEKFSIPFLSDSNIEEIMALDGKDLDAYLWKLYGLE